MPTLPFESAIDGIGWPAVPARRGAAMLAILFQLDLSQWWTTEELRQKQAQQLGRLLAHALVTVPFYRDRLAGLDFSADGAPLPECWSRLPLLRRDEVQTAGDALISGRIPPSHGELGEIFTSGSTGKPIRAVTTQLSGLFWSAFTVRDHLWHRRDLRGTLAGIRESAKGEAPYPDGTRAESWGQSSGRAFATGPMVSLNITCPLEQQVDWLQRQNPDYLLTHPSIAERLAAYCLEHGIALPKLRQVETISEILRPDTRTLCREAWGVPVVDVYSTREVGYVALQCPDHEHYHIQSEGIVVEVLDDHGESCAAGEVGRVVVTPLHNFAMPLIRYDIGDFAEVGDPCPCGRGLPVLRRIHGRRQNMLIMPSGEERWPLLSSGDIQALLAIAPIRQYQFAQTARGTVELRLATARPLATEEEEALRAWARDKFGHPFDVPITYHEDIPRSAAGKFQDFVTEIDG